MKSRRAGDYFLKISFVEPLASVHVYMTDKNENNMCLFKSNVTKSDAHI